MRLSKIRIKNYRLLLDAELEVDSKTTLIVGLNILDPRNHDSGKLETDIPDVGNRLNSA